MIAKLAGIVPVPLDPGALLTAIGEEVGTDQAVSLLRLILALRSFARRAEVSAHDVIADLDRALGGEVGQGMFPIEDWKAVRGEVLALLDLECVGLAAMAIELSYDHANLLVETKILTDIRPLYTDSADRIQGAVVSFTLRMKYRNADGEQDLSVALDENDIESLQKQCNRAVTKASVARSLMIDKCDLPVANSREVSRD